VSLCGVCLTRVAPSDWIGVSRRRAQRARRARRARRWLILKERESGDPLDEADLVRQVYVNAWNPFDSATRRQRSMPTLRASTRDNPEHGIVPNHKASRIAVARVAAVFGGAHSQRTQIVHHHGVCPFREGRYRLSGLVHALTVWHPVHFNHLQGPG